MTAPFGGRRHMNPIIEVKGLTKIFGDLIAVDHIHFTVDQAEVFGFLGPNGAGKTTTVRMLTGVMDPTEGTASILGHDIRKEPLMARQHLGIVPEEANIYLDLSVWQNMMLMAELHGMTRRERKTAAERLLDAVGLSARKKSKARSLSKGLRQRLLLCTALVAKPQILFLDEPTSGLDIQSTRLIRRMVAALKREGLTVFLTTHDMAEAEEMCSRVAIINNGKISAIDTPEELRAAIKSSRHIEVSFDRPVPDVGQLEKIEGVESIREVNGTYRLYCEDPGAVALKVAWLAKERGLKVVDLRTCKASLEDVFLHFTARVR